MVDPWTCVSFISEGLCFCSWWGVMLLFLLIKTAYNVVKMQIGLFDPSLLRKQLWLQIIKCWKLDKVPLICNLYPLISFFFPLLNQLSDVVFVYLALFLWPYQVYIFFNNWLLHVIEADWKCRIIRLGKQIMRPAYFAQVDCSEAILFSLDQWSTSIFAAYVYKKVSVN